MTSNLDTVRAYWDASARGDYETAGRCIGDGYVWVDHTREVVARATEELQRALQEDSAWSDRTFDITNAVETTDGTLVVQATISGTLTGTWHSIVARGQRVSSATCSIFRFDAQHRIVWEEHYSDALTIMKKLTAAESDS
jgi:ketosteroid isomerase-like protein